VALLSAWALAGLLLIAPLVLLHLRRRRPPLHEVPSLLIWQELRELDASGERHLRIPRLPLLLLLQALALALLVVALARPTGGASAGGGSERVLVLDDSMWMTVPGRLATGERELERFAAGAPGGTRIGVVVSAGAPYVLYRGGAGGVAAALAGVHPTMAPARLGDALSLAGALLDPGGRIALARAPEDALPSMTASAGELHDALAGPPVGEQGIFSASARCGIGRGGCEVLAMVRNSAPAQATDEYVVEGTGAAPGRGHVSVPAEGEAAIALAAPAGAEVSLRLPEHDALAAAARAWVRVPGAAGPPPGTRVTLVGEPADALPVARALAAVAGVRLRLRTPRDYRMGDARASDVVVFDGWLPRGSLPQAPGILLIDPPRVPGGHVGATMDEAAVSGTDASSPLLEGVDLSSLAVDAGGARVLSLPAALRWIAWSPAGPLLASGADGGRQLAVLSFDPALSDLPQLPAFPVLVANLVRALASRGPATAPSDADLASPQERSPAVDIRATGAAMAGGSRANLAPWALLAALLVMLFEAAYGARQALPT
jgi:hypothetical protein